MNINPYAKRILCFGDSNTHGTIPYKLWSIERKRYSTLERWTGVVQSTLWDDYEIIEEGRWWRIIHISWWEETDMTKLWSLFLEWLLHTHWPLDVVIVMLWTNDVKEAYHLNPQDITTHMKTYIIQLIMSFGCKLLIISPPSIIDSLAVNFPLWSNDKIRVLNSLYKKLCIEYDIEYLDIQDQLLCGVDGIHLTKQSHQFLWHTIAQKIQEII